MRSFLFILLVLSAYAVNAQIYYEDYYPEKELKTRLSNAKTPAEKIYAAGILAIHYKKTFNDSLAAFYVNKVYQLAGQTKNKNLTATALWWDAYSSSVYTAYDEYKLGTTKASKLLQYAKQNNLPVQKIAANLLLCDLNIHNKIDLSEHHALAAKELLEDWKADSSKKDSIKLEVYFRLSHTFIHKMDGVNIARYLLTLQDYAEQSKNLELKIKATFILARMYNEWGQNEKGLLWRKRLCDYYIKIGQSPELSLNLPFLAIAYARTGNKERAKYYYLWADKLIDSLGTFTLYSVVHNVYDDNKLKMGLITHEQVLGLLNRGFGNRLLLPPALIDQLKAITFLRMDHIDSVGYYLEKAKKDKIDSLGRHFNYEFNLWEGKYYLRKKKYNAAVEAFNMALKVGKQRGNRTLTEDAFQGLSEAYEGKKDYKTANQFLKRYYQFKDSLNSVNQKEEVTLMEMQKQKDLQTAAFREQQRAQQEEQSRIAYKNQIRFYALLLGVALLLLMAGILYRNNLQKQKANLLLQQKNEQIQNALTKLKVTQAQLIQKEKMASLGELTTGIAHEIQNPLNFVNNFSEVNTELLVELKNETEKENMAEVKAITKEIEENEHKINYHGKRADSIVKGMLQHSRSSTGEKQLTDINALAEEYLRLTYHGLRGKDKDFNANLITDLDNTLGKIEVVPQELGRVLLNLYNNAFYATQQKKAQLNGQYQPEVKVTTCRQNGQVEIRVRDNGNGIPEADRNKIFQPFFTTKPTGQGTGLGLSLSYDIITKGHQGELRVESLEGQFAEFTIHLPV